MAYKRALANVAASQTDSSLVAAVASTRIKVIALSILAGTTATSCTVGTKLGTAATTAISPAFVTGGAGSALVLPPLAEGWMQTGAGEALVVTTGAGTASGIHVVYEEDV